MKSWRSRIAAAVVVGTAAVTIPLTAGPASAATDPDGFHLVGGFTNHHTCQVEGKALLDEGLYREFQCRWNDGAWEVWVR